MSDDNPNESAKRAWFRIILQGFGALLFAGTMVALFFAEFYKNWMLSKFLSVILIIEVVACIIGIPIVQSQKADDKSTSEEEDKWLLRLVLVTALGMCMVVVYAVQWLDIEAITIAGIGLLAAGAAWLIAALTGFLFGIPHREHTSSMKVEQKVDDKSKDPVQDKSKEIHVQDVVPPATGSVYQGSTSLEQVSDWLTKIIVGVGLTQLNKIPGKLDGLATYIASGMGNNVSQNRVFALTICIYFSSCGFLFGYLWARLYMLKAFERAETKALERAETRERLAALGRGNKSEKA